MATHDLELLKGDVERAMHDNADFREWAEDEGYDLSSDECWMDLDEDDLDALCGKLEEFDL